MKLLNIKNYQIEVTEEALLVKPIRDLFNSDASENKELFYQQCSVIYFMSDPRSSYNYIIDENDRFEEIKKQEGLAKTFKITKSLQKAIDSYKELSKTPASRLLDSANIAVSKVSDFLQNVDLYATDDKGRPVHTINSVTSALKMLPQLTKDLAETTKIVNKELEEQGRMRGGDKNKAMFEDGDFTK
jgi:hypothetical protein